MPTVIKSIPIDLDIFKQELQSRLVNFEVLLDEGLRVNFSIRLFGQDCKGYLEGKSLVDGELPHWVLKIFGFFWVDRDVCIIIVFRHQDTYLSIREQTRYRSLYTDLPKHTKTFVDKLIAGVEKVEEAQRLISSEG